MKFINKNNNDSLMHIPIHINVNTFSIDSNEVLFILIWAIHCKSIEIVGRKILGPPLNSRVKSYKPLPLESVPQHISIGMDLSYMLPQFCISKCVINAYKMVLLNTLWLMILDYFI